MAPKDLKKPSFVTRTFTRLVAPLIAPKPAEPPEPDKPEIKYPEFPLSGASDPIRVPSAFTTGQPLRPRSTRQKRRPKAEFAIQSDSERIKAEQEFDARFKSDTSRASARDAQADAAIARDALKDEHIEELREIREELNRLCSTGRPVPPEAALSNNQKYEDSRGRFERKMEAVERHLKGALNQAAELDLKIVVKPPLKRLAPPEAEIKRIGYVQKPLSGAERAARDFEKAAQRPRDMPIWMWPDPKGPQPNPSPAPENGQVAPLDRREPASTVGPDGGVSVWLESFNKAAPPAARPEIGPER